MKVFICKFHCNSKNEKRRRILYFRNPLLFLSFLKSRLVLVRQVYILIPTIQATSLTYLLSAQQQCFYEHTIYKILCYYFTPVIFLFDINKPI